MADCFSTAHMCSSHANALSVVPMGDIVSHNSRRKGIGSSDLVEVYVYDHCPRSNGQWSRSQGHDVIYQPEERYN